ncbi:methyltransferase type 12, partial [Metarhizium majus ARSEF 297]
MSSLPEIRIIKTDRCDPYRDKVIYTYDDPPESWHKALGENLSFQFGLFDEAEMAGGPKSGSVGPSEFRHFDRQLELAGLLLAPGRPQINRILDLGCGWGYITYHMAALFPECQRIDCVNISQRQLEYCANNVPKSLRSRVNLYLCNGQDVDLLPDPAVPYDLVIVRGVYTHFLPKVFETSVTQVARRLSHDGIVIISDTLYKVS